MKIKGLYRKREWFYWQPPQKDGVRPKAVALETKDAQEAANKVFELRADVQLVTSLGRDSFSEAIKAYIREKRALDEHSVTTSIHSGKVLDSLLIKWGDIKVNKISKEMVNDWREELVGRPGLMGRDFSPASVASYLRVLKGFLTWCVDKKQILEHPMSSIKMGRVKKTRRQVFCTVEERDLLLAEPAHDYLDFILHVGFFTGLRFGEMLAMNVDWLSFNSSHTSGTISVQETDFWKPKDREVRTIPMHKKLVSFFNRYGMRKPFMLMPSRSEWKEYPKYRFNPKKSFANHVKKSGVEKNVTFHTLRHSFATQLAMNGASMYEIAMLLGDEIRVVEENYAAFSPASADVVNLLE